MPLDQAALLVYARDALAILRESLQLCREGRPEFYRVAAVQLRLLLCDTTRRHNRTVDISLLPRLVSGLRLPALPAQDAPGQAAPLALKDWLAQPLDPGQAGSLSVRDLIRRVCDQDGGAHVDLRQGFGIADPAGWILVLGDIVVGNVRGL